MRTCRSASVALLAIALAACTAASGHGRAASSRRVTVATTVAPITDIVREVVGDRVALRPLIPDGVDSHTFEPSPATVKALAGADVLFMDGLHLEDATLKQARANMPKGAAIIPLGERTVARKDYAFDFTFPKSKRDPNPHVWMDPVFAKQWSEIVRDTMATRDGSNASYYAANQARFASALDALDAATARVIASIPEQQRKLLTYHDSFAYFSRRYGIPVIGAVQPSDFSEPSPRDVQRLVDQVRASHVPAIFGSDVFPSKVLERVAADAGARYVDTLRDDVLPGRPDAAEHTYVGLIVTDVRTIASALGGDPTPLDRVPTARTWLP